MMIPKNKIPLTILSCYAQESRIKDAMQTWIPLLDKKYHVIVLLGNPNLKRAYSLETKDIISTLVLRVDDSFDGVSIKMKSVFNFLSTNTNSPYYWFCDNDSYINTKLFNTFNDYSVDWYGFGPIYHEDNGKTYNLMSGCGHYMSKPFIDLSAKQLENWNHAYDAALGKVFEKRVQFKRKYSSTIHPWSGDKNIDGLMIGHYVKNMNLMHSFYK